MDAHALKQAVAKEAINRVESHQGNDIILGIGTGSTAECFIAELPKLRDKINTTVSSSERSSALLLELGFEVQDLNAVDVSMSMLMAPTKPRKTVFLSKAVALHSRGRRSQPQKPTNLFASPTAANW